MAAAILKLIGGTLRWKFHDPSGLLISPPAGSIVFVFWHNRILLVPYFYARWLPHRRGTALVSASRDGEFLSLTLAKFHIEAARGSSSRKGAKALMELHDALEEGRDIAITPDGPRGPIYSIQPGAAAIARQTGLPVVAMGYRAASSWRLKSWDRFIIPKPFSRVEFFLSTQLVIPPEASDEEAHAILRRALESVSPD